jgi:two-component system, response regulator PhcR
MKLDMQQKTILFVDDEVMMTKWFERTFSPDFHIICANSVDEALLTLQANTYNVCVVVTDFRMPGRDGLALLQILADLYPSIVKVLASAYADKDLIIQAVNQQLVFRVLEKPWDDHAARRTLSESLAHHEEYVLERKKLAASMSGMRESLGFLAHELSSPLSTISNYLHLLQTQHASLAATQGTMAATQRRIQFCLSLVNSFTESSRLAFAKTEPENMSALRLTQLVLSELPISNAQRQSITVQFGHDFLIKSKHNLIYLCISCIINNALRELANLPDHTNPRISIDFGCSHKNWIRLTDNANGITSTVFDQLLKKPTTTYEDSGGKGMGLMFCQKVMNSIAGDIALKTWHISDGFTPNETGTSVYLYFPVLEN